MSTKSYVLDTNVLIADPQSIFKFDEHDVYVPVAVLNELDSFKSEMSERGRASRTVARTLDSLREKGNLLDGVPITRQDNSLGGTFRVVLSDILLLNQLPPDIQKDKTDTLIVTAALRVKSSATGPVVLVTQDVGLRVLCDALGMDAEPYKSGRVTTTGLYKGHVVLEVTQEEIDKFYQQKYLRMPEHLLDDMKANQYVLLKTLDFSNKSALARYDHISKSLHPLYKNTSFSGKNPNIWCISPRNAEQRFALDALLDDKISLVTLVGTAGTGKTLMAIAAGLHLTADEEHYSRVLAARPIFPLGRDLGYLPGTKEEKLDPWMQPIYDNIDLLLSLTDENEKKKRGYKELMEMGVLEIEALTYVRGRSIPKQYIVVDEAQNLSIHEVKTIVTRAGEGTKIVLTGDPDQIDNPLLDRSSNGLSYVVEKFKGQPIAAHVVLEKGERSELATLAAEIL